MFNNIYEIMEHMHDVNIDVNNRIEYHALQYVLTEGVGDAVSGIINFIKKLLSTFIKIVKKIISFLTFGLVFGEDSGGSSGGGSSSGKTVTTTTYSTYDKNKSYEPTSTVNGVTKNSNEQPQSSPNNNNNNNNEKRVRTEYNADDKIKVFKGIVQRENIEDVFLYYINKITGTRDHIDGNFKKYFAKLGGIKEFYNEDLDIPEGSSDDYLYQNIKKKLRITQNDLIEVKLTKELMEDLENFLDNESDRIADKLKQVIRTEEDRANKLIRQIQNAELEVDTRFRVDNLNCYINRLTLLIRVIERIFKDYYRGISTIRSAYKTIERLNNN